MTQAALLSLPAGRAGGTRSPLAEPRMDDYRQMLYEWNDSINRNLALVQQYFGEAMRRRLDDAIGAAFVILGWTVVGIRGQFASSG